MSPRRTAALDEFAGEISRGRTRHTVCFAAVHAKARQAWQPSEIAGDYSPPACPRCQLGRTCATSTATRCSTPADTREAIREFEIYVELAPREPNPYDSLGEGHLLTARPTKPSNLIRARSTIDPTFDGAHDGRAWSLAGAGTL